MGLESGEVYEWKQGPVKENTLCMMKNFKVEDCFYRGRDAHNIMLFQSSLMVVRHIYWGRADPDQTTAVTLTTDDN